MSALNSILVVDEMPAMALGLQNAFSALNASAKVTYLENVYQVLGCKTFEDAHFDLIVIGNFSDGIPESLHSISIDLRKRMSPVKIMIYSASYNHLIIEKMEEWKLDAYVHKHESIEELQKAYHRLAANERYISDIYYTLYNDYQFDLSLFENEDNQLSFTCLQKRLLQLLCKGKTMEEAARELDIPFNEVQQHTRQLEVMLGE